MQETRTLEPVSELVIAAAIRSATAEVFSTMLGMETKPGEIERGATAGSTQSGVVALLGLAGAWVGSGSVACDPDFACQIAGQLLMTEYDHVNEDVLDAVAEVANMIIGNVKTVLEEQLGPLGLSTPTVIFGKNFETRSVGNQDWVIVPFTSGEKVMHVRVSLAPSRGSRPARVPAGFPLTTSVSI